jgi:cytochrome c-type biogenesis protein CcmH
MRSNKHIIIILMAAVLVLSFAVQLPAATSSGIEQELMCDCGCNDMLVNCTCERSEQMRSIIDGMLDEGKSKEEILASFVSQFGETILSSPPRRGFNLVAYGAPFAGLLLGVGIAFVLVRRWRGKDSDDESGTHDDGDSSPGDEMESRIDEELRKMEEDI